MVRAKAGKINHHIDYVEEKCRMMISKLENIIKLQNDTYYGLENESLNDLKKIESYAKFFQEGYIKEEREFEKDWDEDEDEDEDTTDLDSDAVSQAHGEQYD